MSSAPSLSERLIEAVRSGTARREVRLAAARGALPLGASELITLQVLLYADADTEVSSAARQSLEAVTPADANELAAEDDAGRDCLHFLAGWVTRWPDAGPLLARRADTAPETRQLLVASTDPATLEALSFNQTVLSRDEGLARQLLEAEQLPARARTQLLDFVEELEKDFAREEREERDGKEQAERATEEEGEDAEGLAPAKDPFLAALGIDAEVESMLPSLGIDIEVLSERSELLGEVEDDDDETLITRLGKMNVGQKLRVALFGSKEERTILVRDSNRIVAAAVIKNPKFTESEAEAVAKSRNVSDEVLRLIGRQREFAKNYSVQQSLVLNPRTPPEIATHFINFLNDRDMKMLMKNRSVSDRIRRLARKTFQVREARRSGRKPGR